ncbi:hypothetical protein CSUI_009161 [Cystoisospora suis]|uniref:Uncharacterized protein n=1 Tax=Cystoisospora suis TaxID=483139 RepID=A0A2C6K535_9APIC|nr:hypothetical protein CSUI_009161 [Cystoisospora suis]
MRRSLSFRTTTSKHLFLSLCRLCILFSSISFIAFSVHILFSLSRKKCLLDFSSLLCLPTRRPLASQQSVCT